VVTECPRKRHALLFFAAVLALAWAGSAAAGRAIFKCTLADGKTTYSDTPCPAKDAQADAAAQPAPADAAKQAAKPADPKDCSNWEPPEGDLVVDPPQQTDPDRLPHDAQGRPIEMFLKKPGPSSVAAACSAMVSACYNQNDDKKRTLDACFKSAPRCTSSRPWEEDRACCPQTCWQKYSDLRRRCVEASSASYKALFEEHCVPDAAK